MRTLWLLLISGCLRQGCSRDLGLKDLNAANLLGADHCCYGDQYFHGSASGLTLIVASTRGRDVSWLTQQPYPAYVKADFAATGERRYGGREAGSYLHFIVDHYQDLPSKMLFMQDQRTSPEMLDAVRMLKALDPASYDIAFVNRWFEIESDVDDIDTERRTLQIRFGKTMGVRDRLAYYVGATFLVSSDHIRNTSLATWQRWLQEAQLLRFGVSQASYRFGSEFEKSWHMLFGQSLRGLPAEPARLCPKDPAACQVHPMCHGSSACSECNLDPVFCPEEALLWVGPHDSEDCDEHSWWDPYAGHFGYRPTPPCAMQTLQWWRHSTKWGQRRRRRLSSSMVPLMQT